MAPSLNDELKKTYEHMNENDMMTKRLFMSEGKRRFAMLVVLFLLAISAFAVPAKPGLTRLLTLTDGTTVSAMLVGDEFAHYWLGTDGQAYQSAGNDVYQPVDRQMVIQRGAARRAAANQQRTRRLAPNKVGTTNPISGDKKGIIILVNFQDVSFTATQSDFNNLANKPNYNSGNFKGSMYDYFYAQSEGQFRLTFDVVGPYTVSQNCAYYGANNNKGDDVKPGYMVQEALQLADRDVNYADYDWNNDGTVEQVYVVYAGKGEADGGAPETIWPHAWNLKRATGSNITLDGVTISTYACGGELNGSTGETAGIGTMCHEFSHCLGYPDFYDTDYSGGQGMGYWDLMDSGSYNGDGYRPAGYTSYERWVAGWKTPIELTTTQDITNMAALQTFGSNTYIIYNKSNNNEYYLLENRQKTAWDTSLPGAGLLILHVDYNESIWSNNRPNDDPAHQRMTWIPADNEYQSTVYEGTTYYLRSGMKNDPFPYGNNNSFGKNTTPAAELYNKNSDDTNYLDCSLDHITQNSDGTIAFHFNGESNLLPAIVADESLTFSTTIGTPQTMPLEVLSEGLTDDITLTLSDANGVFTLGATTIAHTTEDATVNVTFTSSTAGTYTGTITLSSEGADDVIVGLLATAREPSSSNPSATTFKLVTSTNDLEEGMRYIIACGSKSTAAGALSDKILVSESVSTSNNVITIGNGVAVFVLEGDQTNGWAFKNESNNQYLYATSTKNLAYGSEAKKWTLSNTTVGVIMTYGGCGTMLYNVTAPRFTTYTSDPSSSMIQANLYMEYSETPDDPTLEYYKRADTKKGETLKSTMCSIIYNRTETTYNYLWTAFHTTDVRSDGKIWDMYSSITNYEPGGPAQGADVTGEGNSYNREHSFPKSWFGGEVTPMYVDLHHIYPTDGYVNNRHSNYPFGETNGETYKSANGFSKLGTCTYAGYTGTVFEPADEYKGDFARTYFYMVTCYEEKLHDWYTSFSTTDVTAVLDGSTYPGLTDWQLSMLMKWAKDDPVSEKETNRNNAVYAIQNNRNPFIDYPGLEEYVWGYLTTSAFSYNHYLLPVYMSFSFAEASATQNGDFEEPTLSWSGYSTPDAEERNVTYSSSDPSVAMVNASTGEVTIVGPGTTTITATFAGNESYAESSASYTLTVSEPTITEGETLLYEGLTKYDSNGDSSTELKDSGYLDYSGWTSISKVYPGGTSGAESNGGCLKFGSSKSAGSMTTTVSLTGNAVLMFYLKKYGQDDGTLNLTVTGATADVTQFTPQTDWTLCTVNLTQATGSVSITLATSEQRAYVDEICLTTLSTLALADDGSNSTAISTAAASGQKYNVALRGRTLYKDGEWNTICLPFTVALEGSPLEGAIAKTLTGAAMEGTHVTLTFGNNVSTLTAGTPYIIKWNSTEGADNIVNPVFEGVTVVSGSAADRTITLADGHVQFIGYYDAFPITAADENIYYMTTGSLLKHTAKNRTLKACRAYFLFSENYAGREFILNFSEGEATDIDGINNLTTSGSENANQLYDLLGRKIANREPVNGKLPKGLYILNGRKVVIR
jgi:M6 family metalloprotease-like protein